ncbi:MAG: lipoyl(octanoyl) transferase LipB [Polyangia bacterium]
MSKPARVIELGTRDYAETWRVQQELLAARQRDEVPDTLVLVEHPHVLTVGRGAHRENLLTSADMQVFEVERGGDVTYHGPGQLCGYPILYLREDERDVHLYLRRLEEAIIRTLAEFTIEGDRRPGLTGVWVGPRKLASIGVAVRRWVTMHGFALNVCTDLERFSAINPCGLSASTMDSMTGVLGRPVAVAEVLTPLLRHLATVLDRCWAEEEQGDRRSPLRKT